MIQIDNISKSFGPQTLFEEASFKVNPKERVGLVGRNGHGKTTLVKLLAGDELPDDGQILFPKHYRLGYVRQHLDFSEKTVLAEVAGGLPDDEKDQLWKAERILFGLGFSAADLTRSPADFSGGFQVRINLARVVVSEPDLLLLDEPTNYLDITSIRWMERFLMEWPRELLLITHDRSFMDRVVTHTVGIHRKKIRKVKGNTEKFYGQIAQEEEIYEKTRLNDEKKRKEIELFVTRFRAKARLANMVQSRVKTLQKMEKRDKLDELRDLEFAFRMLPYRGKYSMHTQGLTFGYGDGVPLVKDLSVTIGAGERICIIGKNGRGKTTLLKLLAGIMAPDAGEVVYNPGVAFGTYEQTNIESLHPERTVEDEILTSHPDMERQQARNICGSMMFEGDQALKKVKVLSGGEKSRVMLGRLLATPVNLLFLDEPTNHLDMNACDALLEAIDAFPGTIVMVTHNEMFLNAVANRLIVFRDEGPMVFDGTYPEFLEKIGWGEDGEAVSGSITVATEEEPVQETKLTRKEARKIRSEIVARRSKALRPLETAIEEIEDRIELLENGVEERTESLQAASESGDGAAIAVLSQEIGEMQAEVDTLFDALAEKTEELEAGQAGFDREMQEKGVAGSD